MPTPPNDSSIDAVLSMAREGLSVDEVAGKTGLEVSCVDDIVARHFVRVMTVEEQAVFACLGGGDTTPVQIRLRLSNHPLGRFHDLKTSDVVAILERLTKVGVVVGRKWTEDFGGGRVKLHQEYKPKAPIR